MFLERARKDSACRKYLRLCLALTVAPDVLAVDTNTNVIVGPHVHINSRSHPSPPSEDQHHTLFRFLSEVYLPIEIASAPLFMLAYSDYTIH